MMDWHSLLSDKRLGKTDSRVEHDRTAFQKDVDRIIFSSAFRRLQDKTQVFPLAQNDYVRTRLTHSLEVSSVGRSLGTWVGKYITTGYHLTHINPEDFGSIVAAACLAHDIGNPPFGHFGEEAIRSFFADREIGQFICDKMTTQQSNDLLNFEGNAQGFRILTQLQNPNLHGGMQLTYATLGTFTKYPCTRQFQNKNHIASKKNGLLVNHLGLFNDIAKQLKLIQYSEASWARHPLVYLMEAADDICYAIIDIEDAYQIKQIDFSTAYDLLSPLAHHANQSVLTKMDSNSDKLSYLRAKAIGNLAQEAVKIFMQQEKSLLAGEYTKSIVDDIPSAKSLSALINYASKHIYNCSAVVKTEIPGHRILGDLMEIFSTAVEDIANAQQNATYQAKATNKMLINLLPTRFIGKDRVFSDCPYQRALGVVDYISGMTDSYAVGVFQRLTGISIPSKIE
ncbi:MAG: deoxyguanosinetriphosphate triphosphohydrolase [Ostreibacterium sp.]